MAAQKHVLGFVYTGREIRRAPLIGMQFLHERTVGSSDLVAPRARLQAKDLVGLLVRHFAAGPRPAIRARCRVSLRVFTPAGLPAVEIRHQ